ncbi:ankyrin repeat domain-containing protein [Jiangella alba]|uniref:Uncharacterized protein n=1 Tax=Jiangella alba TaxID=561176 RepID=A0A1H5IZ13_9ACTN|nr:ankyrin repeat domain-containing protein [Jiangella alba]SEE45509.1 hypothetical protein SAMN04488561_1374 [Jiangella alba]
MPELPVRPDLGHLKKQAKELLRAYRDGDPAAAARFRATLPHATGPHGSRPRLRDAQSCVAREYGFASWTALRRYVEEVRGVTAEHWLRLVYAGDSIGGTHAARPVEAARLLRAARDRADLGGATPGDGDPGGRPAPDGGGRNASDLGGATDHREARDRATRDHATHDGAAPGSGARDHATHHGATPGSGAHDHATHHGAAPGSGARGSATHDGGLGSGPGRDDPLVAAGVGLLAAAAGDIATATGDVAAVTGAIAADPGWVHRPGGVLGLPPLVAVAHSSLVRLPEFATGLRACARTLLTAGADPNQAVVPAGGQHPVTALYGAAGVTHDHELTTLLLAAGADPDDGESLYHSLGDRECARLLLAAGATVTGTNAMYAAADHDDAGVLRLLLEHGGDPNEPSPVWGSPLLFGLRRRCSTRYVRLLLDAGADPRAVTPDGVGAYRLALRFGLTEAASLLPADDAGTPLEELIAACARGDGTVARTLLAAHPGLTDRLDDGQRRLLPDLAGEGAADAVRLLVEAGWPIDQPGGDWNATALNHAVFRGDAALARFLLEHGADPAVVHGFGDTVTGTLAWASSNNEEPGIVADWAGCARALLDHGVELPELS